MAAAPPPLCGVEPFTVKRWARLMWWVTKHLVPKFLPLLAVLVVALLLLLPDLAVCVAAFIFGVSCIAYLVTPCVYWLRGRWLVGAFSEDAGVLIYAGKHPGTWELGEHAARKIGCGYGKQLRQIVMPQLLAAAVERDLMIEVKARPKVAAIYRKELEGVTHGERIRIIEKPLIGLSRTHKG